MAEETTCKCQFRPVLLEIHMRFYLIRAFSCRLQSRGYVRCHSSSYFLCPVGRKGPLSLFIPSIRSPLHSCEDLEWYLVVKWLWVWAALGLGLLLPPFFSSSAFFFSSLHLLSHFSFSIAFFFFSHLLFSSLYLLFPVSSFTATSHTYLHACKHVCEHVVYGHISIYRCLQCSHNASPTTFGSGWLGHKPSLMHFKCNKTSTLVCPRAASPITQKRHKGSLTFYGVFFLRVEM